MGFLDKAKDTATNYTGVGQVYKAAGNGGLFGSSSDAGLLGVGQYKAKTIDINKKAFGDQESESRQAAFAQQLAASTGRSAPQMQAARLGNAAQAQAATINQAPQGQFRDQQMTLANQLAAQAAGQGPSLAQSQLQQGTDRNIAQAMAMAASQRGQTAGQGLRQIAQGAAQANQMQAQQAADLRMQEQMAARQQLAGLTASGREQDIGLATNQAGLAQQAALANQAATNQFGLAQAQMLQDANNVNLQARLQQTSLNDNQSRFFNTGLQDMEQRDREAAMALEKLRVDQALGVAGVNQQAYSNASQMRGGVIGGIGQGLAAMSDERVKKDIDDGEDQTQKFLKAFSTSMKGSQAGAQPASSGHEKMGQEIGKGLASLSDEQQKTQVSEGDAKLKSFLNALGNHQYHYKNPEHGEGLHISPMAQELEKSELGKSLVVETPEGKAVNYAKAGGLMLATAAMLNDRMGEMDQKLAKALAKSKRSA